MVRLWYQVVDAVRFKWQTRGMSQSERYQFGLKELKRLRDLLQEDWKDEPETRRLMEAKEYLDEVVGIFDIH